MDNASYGSSRFYPPRRTAAQEVSRKRSSKSSFASKFQATLINYSVYLTEEIHPLNIQC